MRRAPFVACLTTLPSRKEGERIARHLVKRKLAACVNVITGALSYYLWKKKLCRDREVILIIKSYVSKVKSLEQELSRLHPYELPEFIVLPIVGGSKRYLQWLNEGLK